MKRALLLGIAGVGIIAFFVARDFLFWKRYVQAALYSQTSLPESFYEPFETIVGSDGPEPPRVRPELEHLDAAALQAAADYAGAHRSTALIVSRHGHIVFEQYWDDGRFDAVADLGAFNSTIAALMLGIAMGERKIGLIAEPVSNYVEAFRGDERSTITLDDIRRNTSGLAPPAGGRAPWSEAAHERFGTDIMALCTSRELLARPGERWVPQSCDVQLVAHVIERATRERYAEYISDRLWKPIGAADAQLARDNEAGAARAGCCLRARRGDWMRIAELLVSDGRFEGEQIVPPGWVRGMLAPSKANPAFGAQVWIAHPLRESGRSSAHGTPSNTAAAGDAASAEGAGTGAGTAATAEPYVAADIYFLKGAGKSRLWFVPSLGLAILRTGTNSESDTEWDDARVPNLIIRGATDFVPQAAQDGSKDISNLVPKH